MSRLTVGSKSEFYAQSRKLEMGNRLNQWTYQEFTDRWAKCRLNLPRKIGIRTIAGQSFKATGLYSPYRANRLAMQFWPMSESWLFDEGAPNEGGILQGEVMPDERGLYLRYVDQEPWVKTHMRRVFEADYNTTPETRIWKHARGLKASMLLRSHMDASSWDFLNEVMHEYEYPVVEFLVCRQPVGVLRWNTLIWEVRTHY